MDFITANQEKCPDLLFPHVITIKDKTYSLLNFEAFLNYLYPQQKLFTTQYSADTLEELLRDAYPEEYTFYDTDTFFKTWGSKESVPLLSLKYYQNEINLAGRKEGSIDEPIRVVQNKNELVLFNGHHRASYHLLLGKENIQAYIVKVERPS